MKPKKNHLPRIGKHSSPSARLGSRHRSSFAPPERTAAALCATKKAVPRGAAGKQCPKWIEKYPTWLCQQFAIENGPVEIVDLPIKHGAWPFIEDLPIENGDFP